MAPWGLIDALVVEAHEWCVYCRMAYTGDSELDCRAIIAEVLTRPRVSDIDRRARRSAFAKRYQLEVSLQIRHPGTKAAYEARGHRVKAIVLIDSSSTNKRSIKASSKSSSL
jgi:hypothetical protein